jgi:hypothetical protein
MTVPQQPKKGTFYRFFLYASAGDTYAPWSGLAGEAVLFVWTSLQMTASLAASSFDSSQYLFSPASDPPDLLNTSAVDRAKKTFYCGSSLSSLFLVLHYSPSLSRPSVFLSGQQNLAIQQLASFSSHLPLKKNTFPPPSFVQYSLGPLFFLRLYLSTFLLLLFRATITPRTTHATPHIHIHSTYFFFSLPTYLS